MDALLIEDDPDTDTIDQQRMRRAADVLLTTEDAGPIDEIDLELARDRMTNGKAPGLDNINPELIKQGWDLLAPPYSNYTTPVSDMESSLECGRGDSSGTWSKQGTGISQIQGLIESSVSCPRSGSSSKD